MATNCAGCNDKIKDLYYMECMKCQELYDLICINLTKEVFDSLSEANKGAWLCPTCTSSLPKCDNSSTPARSFSALNNTYTKPEDTNINMLRGDRSHANRQVSGSGTLSRPVAQFDITSQFQDLRNYFDTKLESIKKEILEELANKISTFEESVQQIRQQHDAFNDRLLGLETTLDSFRTEQDSFNQSLSSFPGKILNLQTALTAIENENISLKSKLSDLELLEQNVNDVEQRARLNNLEIFGLPEQRTENLVSITCKIAAKLGVPLTGEDIDYTTRLPSRIKNNGLPKTVIIKFKSTQLRDSFLSAARKKRGLTSSEIEIPGDSKPIYINEHLTPKNKFLLKATRTKCRDLGFQNVWTRNAKIYIRQHSKAPALRVLSLVQLESLKK